MSRKENTNGLRQWAGIIVALLLAGAGALVAYGQMANRVQNVEKEQIVQAVKDEKLDEKASEALAIARAAVTAAQENTEAIKENRKTADQDRRAIVKELNAVARQVERLVGEVHAVHGGGSH